MVSSIHGHTVHALRKVVTEKGYLGPGVVTMCNKHIEQDNVDYVRRKRRLCRVCWYHQTILKAPKVGKLRGMPNRVVVLDDAEGFSWDRLPIIPRAPKPGKLRGIPKLIAMIDDCDFFR